MGMLERLGNARVVTLGREFVVGRVAGCGLLLDDARVSSRHALLRWRQGAWQLRDLASRNGTEVAGQGLKAGERRALCEGDIIDFGGEEQRWRLVDAGPPVAAAYLDDYATVLRATAGMLALPDEQAPEVMLFRAESGAWMVELADEVKRASDQQRVMLRDACWRLSIPPWTEEIDTTVGNEDKPVVLRLMTLTFRVSRDEEYIEVDLYAGESKTSLGARSHHYLLLMLARARQQDKGNADVGSADEGWLYTDELCRMIGCAPEQLNINVFRARKQLTKAGVENGAEIVQRRPSTRQLRLGTDRVAIHTL